MLANLKQVDDNDDIMIITDTGTIIRIHADEISSIGRSTKGVIIMRTDDNAKIVTVSITPREDEEILEGEEAETEEAVEEEAAAEVQE